MSLLSTPWPALPDETARVARAAFKRQGNLYLTIGDQLDDLFAEVDFGPLYAADGKPALSPQLLTLVTVFQFIENLSDREAADAVRSRIDWKYALHLALGDTGFDASVLSEFRQRLAQQAMGQVLFEQVLKRLQARKLLTAGGKQRTDATYVLGATQLLNRVQLVAETMRLALEALGDQHPEWLRTIALSHWYERYSLVLTGFRLPRAKDKQEALALEIGRDGCHLLAALDQPTTPERAQRLPEVQTLITVWQQQFEQHDDGPHFKAQGQKTPSAQQIVTPHDTAVRFTTHHLRGWEGYQTHWTETCDAERPHLITHVATPAATTVDVELLPRIHAALARLGLLPAEHLVDAGYTSADNLLNSWRRYGVRVVGPVSPGGNWQAGLPDGITHDQFEIDWAAQTARCPQGQLASRWHEHIDAAGQHWTEIHFAQADCAACPVRERCTKSTHQGRRLHLASHYPFMRAARQYQDTAAFKAEYAGRAGVEGTISEAVRAHGARRSRYIGPVKAELQSLLTAMAINVKRSALWLMGRRPSQTRRPGLVCLAPA
jgi:transposase